MAGVLLFFILCSPFDLSGSVLMWTVHSWLVFFCFFLCLGCVYVYAVYVFGLCVCVCGCACLICICVVYMCLWMYMLDLCLMDVLCGLAVYVNPEEIVVLEVENQELTTIREYA